MGQTIERIILATPRSDISQAQLDAAIEEGRVLLSAIPGVELISFGIAPSSDSGYPWYVRIRFKDDEALQVYETHPNHINFGMQHWLPIIKEQITTDYRIQYDTSAG